MSAPHRAPGRRHRRRPQRPGGRPRSCSRCCRCWASGTARASGRPAAAGDHRFGQWIRFSHDGRGFLAYESRTWRLTDDGAIVGPDARESGFWRPRGGDDVELLVASPDGLVELYVGTARTTTSWELHHRRAGPHPGRPRRRARRAPVRHRRRRAACTRSTAPAPTSHCARPCPPDSNGSDDRPRRSRATPARSPTAYVDAVCDLDPIVATSLGTRPGDDRLPDLEPRGPRGRGRAGRAARSPSSTGCWPPTRPSTTTRSSARCARLLRERLGAELAAHEAGEGLPRAVQPVQPGALDPPGVLAHAGGHRRRLGRHRPPDGAGARGLPRLPRDPGGGRPPRAARRARARSPPWSASSTSGWPGPYFAGFAAGRPRRRCARELDAAGAGRRRRRRRDARLPARHLRAAGRGHAGRRRPRALRARPPAAGPARTSAPARASRRPTPGAGPSTSGSWPSSATEADEGPARRRPRWRPCAGSTSTARPWTAWRRSAPGCRR